eukprot:13250463-Alexandrium_andersonii.AAC.1
MGGSGMGGSGMGGSGMGGSDMGGHGTGGSGMGGSGTSGSGFSTTRAFRGPVTATRIMASSWATQVAPGGSIAPRE